MPDGPFIRTFSLSPRGGHFGVSCDSDGVFVGPAPLLERIPDCFGRAIWRPRPTADVNRDLSFCYGQPVDVTNKASGLAAVANALNNGELLRAQIATLHLQLPDLPRLNDGTQVDEQHFALAKALHWSGLLKSDWNPDKHPRLGGPPNAGWFAPTGGASPPLPSSIPVADFSGGFHDSVVEEWVTYLNRIGIPAVKAPAIRIIGPYNYVIGYPDIILHEAGEPLEVIEVKTGSDPPLTPNQAAYLPMLQIGGHIYSTDPRIRSLGLTPGVPFPPAVVYIMFANPGEPYDIRRVNPPVVIPAPSAKP